MSVHLFIDTRRIRSTRRRNRLLLGPIGTVSATFTLVVHCYSRYNRLRHAEDLAAAPPSILIDEGLGYVVHRRPGRLRPHVNSKARSARLLVPDSPSVSMARKQVCA